jgi:copper resistance protein C
MKTKPFLTFVLFAAATLLPASLALGHAFLDHSEPKVGSEISQSPKEVKIWFTEEVEPAFSSIEVWNAQGKQVDLKDTHRDATNKALLIVSVPPLADGQYTVKWSVVAVDTHHTHGDFKFTVSSKS